MRWHYSKAMPRAKVVCLGAWEDSRFIGAILFGIGANNYLVAQYGLAPREGCELCRIALGPHKTPVSRIVRIAISILRRTSPGLRLIVSFADTDQGHHGGVYQAGGWIFAGSSTADRGCVLFGKKRHRRSFNSFVSSKKTDLSLTHFEFCRRFIDPSVRQFMSSSKLRYLFPLDDEIRARVLPLAQPYPKRQKQAMSGDQPEQRECNAHPDAPSIAVSA